MTDDARKSTHRPPGLESIVDNSGNLVDRDLLEALLEVRQGGDAAHLVARVAGRPLADLIGRSGKRIRGRLVEIGYELGAGAEPSGDDADRCRKLAASIEALHAGSLAIDDLQDGSRMRRGAPSLHVKYGVPLAVNIGTLLYYWPPETMASLNLDAETELRLLRLYNRTLVRAHLGQTIDLGIPVDTIPQDQVFGACLASMELKSGALFAMSLLFGAIVGRASDEAAGAIGEFGHGFGVALQMFDDIGNVRGAVEPAKRWEDLILRRPTWIWACAARYFSKDIYSRFVLAVHELGAGDRHPLETWFDQHDFLRRATKMAHDHVECVFAGLEAHIDGPRRAAANRLRKVASEIARAYE